MSKIVRRPLLGAMLALVIAAVAVQGASGRFQNCTSGNEYTTVDTLGWFVSIVADKVGNPAISYCESTGLRFGRVTFQSVA